MSAAHHANEHWYHKLSLFWLSVLLIVLAFVLGYLVSSTSGHAPDIFNSIALGAVYGLIVAVICVVIHNLRMFFKWSKRVMTRHKLERESRQ